MHAVLLQIRRAAIGSRNPAKVEAVKRALEALAPGCEVVTLEVASGVGAQPIGDAATRRGARRRARAALRQSGADIGFGLEGGVVFASGRVWLCSWVAALDRRGRLGEASGLRMELPPALADDLRAGRELGDLVDALFGVREAKRAAGAIGLLTGGAVSRTDAFADLVAMALAPFLHQRLYPPMTTSASKRGPSPGPGTSDAPAAAREPSAGG